MLDLLVLAGYTLLLCAAAARVFRWERQANRAGPALALQTLTNPLAIRLILLVPEAAFVL